MSKILEDVRQKVNEILKDSLSKIGLHPIVTLNPEIGILDVYITRDEREVDCPFSVDTFFGRTSFSLSSDVVKHCFYFLTTFQINNIPGCNILERLYVDSEYEAVSIETIVRAVKSHITLLSIIHTVGIPAKSFTNIIWETDHGGLYDFAIKSELLTEKSIPLIVDLEKVSLILGGSRLWICFNEFDDVNRKSNKFASIRLIPYYERVSWKGGSSPDLYELMAVRQDFNGEDTTDKLVFTFKTWEETILALFKERVGENIRNLIEVSYQKMY